mmetsp:Transcript_33846/g.76068  ORF Transcript_33846/g.76068 Transcript_33846/m.76068 type:complete len:267 (-) Transcript_33846:520-1320(-)
MPVLQVSLLLLLAELALQSSGKPDAVVADHMEDDAGQHVGLLQRASHGEDGLGEVVALRLVRQLVLDVAARLLGSLDDVLQNFLLCVVAHAAEVLLKLKLPASRVPHADVEARVRKLLKVLLRRQILHLLALVCFRHGIIQLCTMLGKQLHVGRELEFLGLSQQPVDRPQRMEHHDLIIQLLSVGPDKGCEVVVSFVVVNEVKLATPLLLHARQPISEPPDVSERRREADERGGGVEEHALPDLATHHPNRVNLVEDDVADPFSPL